jgi:hypothetical protein
VSLCPERFADIAALNRIGNVVIHRDRQQGSRIGPVVNVIDQEAKRYYEQFGYVAQPSNELELFRLVKTIQAALTPLP